ncbi:MAG: ATP-binding cassette domain-containing protein [Ezakiella sp.]|nr:ATP-binding cassette domain-containing protein [Ezakiella sp.]
MKNIKRSLWIAAKIQPITLVISILVNIFDWILSLIFIHWTAILFEEVSFVLKGNDINFSTLLIFVLLLLLVKLPRILYTRYFSTFVGMPKLELKLKNLLHGKINKIASDELIDPKMDKEINQAIYAGTNIFRLIQLSIDLVFAVLSSISIIYVLIKIDYILGIGILFAIVPNILVQFLETKVRLKNHDQKVEFERKERLYLDAVGGDPQFVESRLIGADKFYLNKFSDTRLNKDNILIEEDKKVFLINQILNPIIVMSNISDIVIPAFLLFYSRINFFDFGAAVSSYGNVRSRAINIVNLMEYGKKFSKMVDPYFSFMDRIERDGKSIKKTGDIECKHVFYKYPNSNIYSIEDVNIKIDQGEKIAVVGLNGAGKTTFVRLILGELTPSKGDVFIDGVSTKNIAEPDIYYLKSQVSQFFNRYSLSLVENIAFDNQLIISREELSNLLKTNIDLDQELTKEFGGVDISGGEWQRIAILRGFNKKNNLIILDEPTSAIDPLNEKEIYDFFESHTKDKTMIIVTHRMGVIKLVDRIVVMSDGRIVEDGCFDELINKDGYFSQIYASQSGLFK